MHAKEKSAQKTLRVTNLKATRQKCPLSTRYEEDSSLRCFGVAQNIF
jgi:hypothetical protein